MTKLLKTLAPTATNELTAAFLDGTAGVDLTEHFVDYPRGIDLRPLARVVEEATKRFSADSPEQSDAWLAPRVHACLRLTRREAGDRGLWSYLAIVQLTDYVRWRWGTPTAVARYLGSETNQAIARLWWGAELTRDGPDYAPVERAFEFQDIPNTWFRLDAFHSRPAALASLRVIQKLTNDGMKKTRKINRLSTAVNAALTTTVLDAVAPAAGTDAGAFAEWRVDEPDETLMLTELPPGPPEETVEPDQIEAVESLIERVARGAGLLGEGEVGSGTGSPGG